MSRRGGQSEGDIGDCLGAFVDQQLEDVKLTILFSFMGGAQYVRLSMALGSLYVHVGCVVALGSAVVAAAEDGYQGAAKLAVKATFDGGLILVASDHH